VSTRRGFLGAVLALAAAPAIVKASSLMPIYVPKLVLWGDGVTDDSAALQAFIGGSPIIYNGSILRALDGHIRLPAGEFLLASAPLQINGSGLHIAGNNTTLRCGPGMPALEFGNAEKCLVTEIHAIFEDHLHADLSEPLIKASANEWSWTIQV
jgi:hypothetical protein